MAEVSYRPLSEAVLDDGRRVHAMERLLPRLRLPFEHVVLACVSQEAISSDGCHVLVRKTHSDPQPFVIYRVDPRDGTCHGGHYCGSMSRALEVFVERAQQAHSRAVGLDWSAA